MQSEPSLWVEELAHLHGRQVFAAAYRVLGNPDDAEDVLQAVFMKLLSGRIPRDAAREWGAFLCVTATRQAIDVLRQRNRRAHDGMDQLENIPTSANGLTPGQAIDARRAAEQLRHAMAQLEPRDARIFALRYFEELPYEDIAQKESMSVSQVGVIIHRSRKRLRELLQPVAAAMPLGKN